MKKILALTTIAVLTVTSCQNYLDINTNPNSPSAENLTSDMIFPAVEMTMATRIGHTLRIQGGYLSEQYAQTFGTSNYLDYSKFIMTATNNNTTYLRLYTSANNLKTVLEKAEAAGDKGTILAATVLRAECFQLLVDCYGETPYSEALNPSITQPKFDEGIDIYKGLVAELDAALEDVAPADFVCRNILFPDGTAAGWIKTAKALKLKLLTRMSGKVDVKSQIAALVAENDFPASDVQWGGCFANQSGSTSPMWSEEVGSTYGTQKNVAIGLPVLGTMKTYDDARMPVFFKDGNGANGNFPGAISGTHYAGDNSGKLTNAAWATINENYDSPVKILTVAETEFFIAEYYAKNGSHADAKKHYEAAIQASFAAAGVASGAADAIEAYPYESSNWAKNLGIQKYLALSGVNSFEAYCEVRRLKYPAFNGAKGSTFYNEATYAYDVSSYEPGTLYTPINVEASVGDSKLLQRWPYANSASSRNKNCPSYKGATVPIFWAE